MLVRITCFISAMMFLFCVKGQEFSIKVYHIKDGLPGSNIQSVMQDSRGYLWISSNGGLTKFDGSSFKNYGIKDSLPNYFPSNSLIEDSAGTIWFSRKDGVCGFDGSRFINYPVKDTPAYFWVTQLNQTPGHKLRFITSTGIYELRDKVWWKSDIAPAPPGTFYNYFEELDNGSLLLNLRDSIVIRKNDISMITIARTDAENPVYTSLTKTRGGIYISSRNHLYLFRNNKLELVHDDILKGKWMTTAAFTDRQNRLWVGTIRNGIYVFSGNSYRHINPGNLNLWSVNGFCEDTEGNIWAASSNGLIRLKPSFVDFYTNGSASPEHRAIRSAYKDDKGMLYFGHVRGGFEIWQHEKLTSSYNVLDKMSAQKTDLWIHTFAGDEQHRLWLLNNNFEIMRMKGQHVETIHHPQDLAPTSYAMAFNPFDSAIYTGYQAGLIKIKNDTFYSQRIFKDSQRIDCIFIDPYKRIWIATEKGSIYLKTGEQIRMINSELGLHNVNISKILWIDDNNIWIATYGKGMYKYHRSLSTGRLQKDMVLTSGNGLPHDYIVDFAVDKTGRLWVVTMTGLISMQLDAGSKYPKIYRYGEEDGFTDMNFLTACTLPGNNGDIWIGTDDYLARIYTGKIREDTIPPRVYIEHVGLFNNNAEWGKYTSSFSRFFNIPLNVVLPYDANDISIDFKAVCFSNNKNITYSYKLEGIDKDWINIGNSTHLTFGKLMPGNYAFKVRAGKPNSAYSNVAVFTFIIDPPWWTTSWFFILLSGVAITLFYGLYRYRVHHIMRIQGIRNKIASDLHDDIGSTLNSISVYSEIARQDVHNRNDALHLIGDSARKVIDSMSDIVWTINPANDSFEKIMLRMRSLAYHLLRAKNIEFTFRTDAGIPGKKVSIEERKNFYLIFKETLNNLLKYANATHVEIAILLVDHMVVLRITDNGIGFDPGKLSNGNGLNNMKQRAKDIKAILHIRSAPGAGTIIELVLKKTAKRSIPF